MHAFIRKGESFSSLKSTQLCRNASDTHGKEKVSQLFGVEPDGESALAASFVEASGHGEKNPAGDAEQRAQVQQRITAVWDAHYARVKEVGNELG